MYVKIYGKLKGKVGCACIFLEWHYLNKIRNEFIENGRKYEFLQVQIIDEHTLNFIDNISQSNQKPNDGDSIWLFKTELFRICYIWEKTDGKAKIIKNLITWPDLENYNDIKTLKCNDKAPKFIIYNKSEKVEQKIAEIASYEVELILFRIQKNKSEAALIKARIMANDPELIDYDAHAHLGNDIIFKINGKDVNTFNKFQQLPLKETITFPFEKNEKVLKVSAYCFPYYDLFTIKINITAKMLKIREIIFTLNIDENGIFTVDYLIPETTVENIEKWLKNSKLKTHQDIIYNIPAKIKANNDKIYAVGIDLGTSRCCAAVNRRDGIETVAIDSSNRQMPSYVGFNEEDAKCGNEMVQRLQNFATSIVFDSKRIIGRSFNEVKINESWPFEIIKLENGEKPIIKVQGHDNNILEKHPEEVAAVLLKHIKLKCEEFQSKELSEVVITVPYAFNKKQKIATEVAGILADWITIHLLPEPVAAAIAYFIRRPIPDKSNMLLFDLGGGTLDVCIFKIANKKLEIIGNIGDNNLGGRDFDEILINHFGGLLKSEYNINVNENNKLKYRLMSKCMEMKHTLSVQNEACLDVSDFKVNIETLIKITREEFEKMSENLLAKIKSVIEKSLYWPNLHPSQINKILIVGGACRMPMVKALLKNTFSKAEQCCEENPDEVVAIGAAYYAYYLIDESQSSCSII